MKLFAIPYAGGHSLVYRNLKTLLEPSVTLTAIEPPGRGKRVKEKLIPDINRIAENLFDQIRPEIESGEEYAIFGHSMGSLIAYLITKIISNAGLPMPVHLFCSGHGAPSVPKIDLTKDLPKHRASSEIFWNYIDSLGALPPELKEHSELMDYFEPIIRADIQALELYQYDPIDAPLPVQLTVLYGINDIETPISGLLPWQNESRHPVDFVPFGGGHFGIFDEVEKVSKLINSKLL
jgi:surfactin synthase thioesterase subunit